MEAGQADHSGGATALKAATCTNDETETDAVRTPEIELANLKADYESQGFAYVRSMFTPEDLAPLAGALDNGAAPGGFFVIDSQGGKQELSVWLHLGRDLIGVIPRLEPVVELAAGVIGGPVYHWHSKLSWKRPNTTSLWDWHQDYGFWADEGVARPDMCTIAIALGPVKESNGCMRLVRGSHHLGTLDVVGVGQSMGSDPAAVEAALTSHSIELCELDPGDVVVFHSNTLHGSGPNESTLPRTMLMISYNAIANPPAAPRHPGYRPDEMEILPGRAITDGWDEVFGETGFIDPSAEGLDQGYSTTSVEDTPSGTSPPT